MIELIEAGAYDAEHNFIVVDSASPCWMCDEPTEFIEVNFEAHLHPGLCSMEAWAMYVRDWWTREEEFGGDRQTNTVVCGFPPPREEI